MFKRRHDQHRADRNDDGKRMIDILFASLMLCAQNEPAGRDMLDGDAAFSYRIESSARARGIHLIGVGCAVYDCDAIGERAYIFIDDVWFDARVVDCTARHDRAFWRRRNRIVDIPYSKWVELGLPLRPYPAFIAWAPPRHIWH